MSVLLLFRSATISHLNNLKNRIACLNHEWILSRVLTQQCLASKFYSTLCTIPHQNGAGLFKALNKILMSDIKGLKQYLALLALMLFTETLGYFSNLGNIFGGGETCTLTLLCTILCCFISCQIDREETTPSPNHGKAPSQKLTNQFNFCERASQTYNNPYRVRFYPGMTLISQQFGCLYNISNISFDSFRCLRSQQKHVHSLQ